MDGRQGDGKVELLVDQDIAICPHSRVISTQLTATSLGSYSLFKMTLELSAIQPNTRMGVRRCFGIQDLVALGGRPRSDAATVDSDGMAMVKEGRESCLLSEASSSSRSRTGSC